jgi:hypothetical protein
MKYGMIGTIVILVCGCSIVTVDAAMPEQECKADAQKFPFAERAFMSARRIVYFHGTDYEYQLCKKTFLSYLQLACDGETILYKPYTTGFCQPDSDSDRDVIQRALCAVIGNDADLFSSLLLRQSYAGDTPFHHAIYCCDARWLCMLLNVALYCAEICPLWQVEELLNIKNKAGETIFDVALRARTLARAQADKEVTAAYEEMFKLLRKFKKILFKKSSKLY